MVAALVGIALVILAVLLWVGGVSVAHAIAIFIGLIGVLLVLYWGLPGGWGRRA
jgi:hypothetical protein